jgi:hypothetical protein
MAVRRFYRANVISKFLYIIEPTTRVQAAIRAYLGIRTSSHSFRRIYACLPRSRPHQAQTNARQLVRYQDRIGEVLGEARGQRVMIRSIHADDRERRTAVKWINLLPLDGRHF